MNASLKIILKKIGNDLVKDLRQELDKQDYFASGSLNRSIKANITSNGLNIVGNGYGLIINQGRDGSAWSRMPNIEDLRDWVRTKGFASDEREVKQIAYFVGKKIMREGLPNKDRNAPKLNFIGNVVNKTKTNIAKNVNQAISKDIMFEIKKLKKYSDGSK